MNHRLRVPVSVGNKVVFKSPKEEHSFTLESFSVSPDRITWIARLSNGESIEGRIKDEVKLPFIKGAWACLAIPVVVHVYAQNSIDFIFCVPSSFQVEAKSAKESIS